MRRLFGIVLAVSAVIGSVPSAVFAEGDLLVGVEAEKPEETKKEDTQKKEVQTESSQMTEAPDKETQTEKSQAAESTEPQPEGQKQTESTDAESEKETVASENGETEKQPESGTPGADQTESESTGTESETEPEKQEETDKESAEQTAAQKLLKEAGNGTYEGTSIAEDAMLTPGTYTVTANLYLPGDANTHQKDVTIYLTSTGNNQTSQVSGNATLTVGADGVAQTLTIPVKNAECTLQKLGGGSNASVTRSAWDSKTYKNTAGATVSGRMTEVTLNLQDNSGKYTFSSCTVFATTGDGSWEVPLTLGVDLASVPQLKKQTLTSGDGEKWLSGSTEGLIFISDAAPDSLQSVSIDGQTLTDGQYTHITQGTTGLYIQISAAYLSTLATGTHSIVIRSTDGMAKGSFIITDAAADDEKEANQKAGEALAPGTYQITANLYLPGELNTELPGTTAYLTNPNNPLGIGGHNGIPTDPVADNATLVVGKDGKKTVILDVVNPVFTLQRITAGADISILGAVRDSEIYTGVSQSASRTGRITKLYLELKSNKGLYQFGDCTEFPTLLEVDWNVPLQLSVDFTGARKTSDSTEVKLPDGATTGAETEATEKQTESETEKKNTKDTDPTAGDGTLKPGTYTVAANIWIDKASSGLPLNPHLTSSVFPPKDPVSNNAKVTIDKNGEATVKVPIVIQSKVMSIKSISGLNIVDSSASGGYLSSITVDLGKVTNPNAVITKSCTVSLDLGELAQTIAKKGREQVWGATFQVNFSGIPSGGSGGGNVDVNSLLAQAENNGQSEQGTNIRIGIRPDDAYSAVYFPLMEEHKNDTEIKESTASGTGISATGSVDTASGQTSVATTEVKNSYLFTIEKLEESEENQDLTEEDRSEALSEQYRKHFTDGTYDLILATPEEAERLYQSEEMKNKFVVLAMNRYEKNADGQSGDAESTDGQTEDAEALVGIDAPDSAASEDGAEIRLLLAAKSFVEKHAVAVTDILSKVKTSAEDAVKEPEKTAVFMVSLGMGTDSAAVQQLLKETKAELLTGTELQEAVDALAEDEDLADLKSEGLCYSTSTVKTTENTKTESEVQTTPETESSETEETEKINITDADSLSAALDAALARKAEDTSDEDGSGADGAGGAVNVSNSSGLDLEAEKAAAESLEPGTYTVSTNLYLPGERNTQLPGTTAYMTNPDNPLGIGDHEGLPIVPAEANGTLVVAEDGTKTVTFDVVNPVFTLQKISAPENSQILAGVRDSERYEGTNSVGVDGRITQLVIRLGDDSAIYPFDDCAEFPTLLETDWYVPLELSVEFISAEKVSDSTEVTLPEDTAGMATN